MTTKKAFRNRWLIVGVAGFSLVLLAYIGSYLPRRAGGEYRLTQTGELRYRGAGLSVSDLEQWSPKDCWWQPNFRDIEGDQSTRGDGLGYLYSPLIAIDRKFSFPDRILFTIEDLKSQAEREGDDQAEQAGGEQPATRGGVDA